MIAVLCGAEIADLASDAEVKATLFSAAHRLLPPAFGLPVKCVLANAEGQPITSGTLTAGKFTFEHYRKMTDCQLSVRLYFAVFTNEAGQVEIVALDVFV